MSVIVKGMEIPDSCYHCKIAESCGHYIANYTDRRHPDCPLIALPEHHGRLVDVDALCEDLLGRWSVAETRKEELIKAVMADVVTPIIACQPTIVESEEEK